MKKLMIAAAALMVAVGAQAASMSWSASNVKNDTGAMPAMGYKAYTFLASASAGSEATLGKVLSLASAEAILGATTETLGVSEVIAKSIGNGSAMMGTVSIMTPYGDDAWNATTAQKTYMIVFNNADATQATKYLVVPAAGETAVTFTDPTEAKGVNFGDQSANTAWKSITAAPVPEPTSAMLLLLGVAGLALKRKRV